MTELLTAAQMRAIEQAAIDSGEVTGLELMERAGQGVVEAIFEEWPELAESEEGGAAPHPAGPDAPRGISGERKAVVLCGPGNNGGDGFVVARLLQRCGWDVDVFLYGDPDKLPPDARVNYARWLERGEIWTLSERAFRKPKSVPRNGFAEVYVDALFGSGLTRGLVDEAFSVVRHLSGMNGDHYTDRLVSIDSPSGLCMDSGRVLQQKPMNLLPLEYLNNLSEQIRQKLASTGGARALHDHFSRLTVCFDSPKPGHFLSNGPKLCGKIVVKDIGIAAQRSRFNGEPYDSAFIYRGKSLRGACRPSFLKLSEPVGRVHDERTWGGLPFYRMLKFSNHHKYSHGHVLILSGPSAQTGAARLAARGALRIGAGLVTVGSPASAMAENAAQLTAIMLKEVDGAEELTNVLTDERINALCLGPGMGVDRARKLVPVALGANRATVLDADVLTAFADAPDTLFKILHENCVLTPHAGEFARLFPDIYEKLNAVPTKGPAYSKVDATREAAARAGCVVLFKGPDTVIAAPNGRCSINSAHYERSAPWLATAGSGDVLAGFITGLLARGFSPMQATETGAWLHVECALSFGPGLIAEDLPETLPGVLKKLGV